MFHCKSNQCPAAQVRSRWCRSDSSMIQYHTVSDTQPENCSNITATTINLNVITDCTAYPDITVTNQTKKKKRSREQTADLSVTVTTINHNNVINISNSRWRVDVKHQQTAEQRWEELTTVTVHSVHLQTYRRHLTIMVSETDGKGTVHSTM